jgi:hypothetical protein
MTVKRPVVLQGLPRLDRFFPHCLLGLIELVARTSYQLNDIKMCWSAHTIEYEPVRRERWLRDNELHLSADIGVDQGAYRRALRRLESHYQISVIEKVPGSLEDLVETIWSSLMRGVPAITSLDMGFFHGSRRSRGALDAHVIGVTAFDPGRGLFRVVDQVKGDFEVTLDDYAASFERHRSCGREFTVVECQRTPGMTVRPLDRATIAADVRRTLDNLESDDPTCGLSALRQLQADVVAAHDVLQAPFLIPGLWTLSHDRYCSRKMLTYWRQVAPEADDLLSKLDIQLRRTFELWFMADATVEHGVRADDSSAMAKLAALLDQVSVAEQASAQVFHSLLARLPE